MTTEELLAQMESEIMPLSVESTDKCVIDPESREIVIPETYQILGVESDEKVERIEFECPKIVGDNIDLSKLQIRINYQNANGDKDQYIVEDVETNGDNIEFSWLLSRKVTQYRGTVQFIVCAVKVIDDATITNEWNTTLAQSEVLEGLEVEEPVVTEEEKDVVVQLLNMVKKTAEDAVKEIQNTVSELIGKNAGFHNSIYRGKNLGTQVTDAQYQAIQAGTFDDLYIGDYWVIGGVTWLIAGFDYYYGCGDTAFNKHHAVIVPLSPLYNHAMNETNTTEGGYVGSLMYTEGLEQAKTQIQQAFGAEHVLSHRIYLVNATLSGRPSAGGWYDSTVDLMNENMVYGCMIYAVANISTAYSVNYRVEKSQLPLFAMYPYASFNRSSFWLRDIASSSAFTFANIVGSADSAGASVALGVRPAFCIGI